MGLQPRTQDSPQRSADEISLSAIPRRMIAAWNRGDGAGFAAPFGEHADFIAFEGTHLTGRADIAAFHQHVFDEVVQGSRLSGHAKFVRFLRPDVAAVHSVVSVTLPGAEGATPSRESMQLFVAMKTGGEWRTEALLNARRLTMEQQLFADVFESLPPQDRQQVRDLVASLQARHGRSH
jgi:uncharacterized protein (TIGR02246 family)